MEQFRFENTVTLTEEQYVAIYGVLPKKPWFRYIRFVLITTIGVVCLFSKYTLLIGLILLGFAVMAVLLRKLIIPGNTRSLFRRHRYLQDPLTYGVSDQKLWVKGVRIDASVDWTMLVVWREVEGWLLLSTSGIPPIYLSIARLKEEGLYKRVREMAKSHAPEYGKGPTSEHDVQRKWPSLRNSAICFVATLMLFAPASALAQEKEAPQFVLKDVNGSTVRLRAYRGKVVLINFWATWCPPCRAEMPDLVKLQRQYAGQGLQIIGITYPPENKTRVRRFARSLKVNYPIILGTSQIRARFSSEETLPLTVVIGRDGKVNDIISGILLRQEFDEKIKPLLMKDTEGEMRHGKSDH